MVKKTKKVEIKSEKQIVCLSNSDSYNKFAVSIVSYWARCSKKEFIILEDVGLDDVSITEGSQYVCITDYDIKEFNEFAGKVKDLGGASVFISSNKEHLTDNKKLLEQKKKSNFLFLGDGKTSRLTICWGHLFPSEVIPDIVNIMSISETKNSNNHRFDYASIVIPIAMALLMKIGHKYLHPKYFSDIYNRELLDQGILLIESSMITKS